MNYFHTHSCLHFPAGQPRIFPASHLTGHLRTFREMSAKGIPLEQTTHGRGLWITSLCTVAIVVLSVAQKIGAVDKVRKLLKSLNNSQKRTKLFIFSTLYDGRYVN